MDGKVFPGETMPDGSFDLKLPVYPLSPLELHADCAGQRSVSLIVQADTRDPSELTACDPYVATAQRGLAQLAEQLEMGCSADEDCVAEPWSGPCAPSCTAVAMSRDGERQLAALQARLESGVCGQFTALGCSAANEPCGALELPRCINRRCEVRSTRPAKAVERDDRVLPAPKPRPH